MGKATVDLPDPLQTTSDVGKPLTSTDDLLAQLAGDEIDRLLAEVDDTSAAATALSAPPPSAAPTAPPVIAEVRPPAAPLAGAEPDTQIPIIDGAEADAVLARDAADLTAELDALFDTARNRPAPPPAPSQPVEDRQDHGAGVDELFETIAAERAGLGEPAAVPAAPPVAPAPKPAAVPAKRPAQTETHAPEVAPLPVYLRPLEWINAPLESCPPPVRDFVGKAAIITLANAAAILAYVLLFRRS